MIISAQTISIIVMFSSGIAIGAIVDGFRLYWLKRRRTKLYKYHRIFEIILFGILGIATFILLFLVKGGAWRFVDPLAQFLGIYMYSAAFKPIIRLMGSVLYFIFVRPILFFGKIIFAILRFPIVVIVAIIKRIINLLKKYRKVL